MIHIGGKRGKSKLKIILEKVIRRDFITTFYRKNGSWNGESCSQPQVIWEYGLAIFIIVQ